MSSKAKIKGTRVEREIVKLFEAEGFSARMHCEATSDREFTRPEAEDSSSDDSGLTGTLSSSGVKEADVVA